MRTYICLGKNGDIINLLPLLKREADESGEKPRLMVAEAFAPMLDGVSYVEPVVWPGSYSDISKAVAEAKKLGGEVVCCQMVGPVVEVQLNTYGSVGQKHAVGQSFNTEAWRVAGRLSWWDDQGPAVFDRRNEEREKEFVKTALPSRGGRPAKAGERLILVAADSSSSPFPYHGLLMELLRLKFTVGYRILDLSQVNAERFYDLLALYEKAHCLVSVDSAPLHLARAVPSMPVIALIQDRPIPWNGSSWFPNWVWNCRYNDFPKRAVEMLGAIESCADVSPLPFVRVWNHYEPQDPVFPSVHCYLPITPGAAARDSGNTMQDPKRVPYLRDCLRMGLRRAKDNEPVMLIRPGTIIGKFTPSYACYAYRLTRTARGEEFSPIVDMLCAPRHWWKEYLSEIPDLLMGSDYEWGRCLQVMFRKHGASDATGAVFRNGKVTQ